MAFLEPEWLATQRGRNHLRCDTSKAKVYAERGRGVRRVLVLRDDAGPHTGTAHCYHLRRQLEFILDPRSPSSLLIFRWLFDSAREREK